MRQLTILVLACILLTSCGEEEKPKVIYPEQGNDDLQELKKDSTLIEIADLPIHIDSTKYLIHPIGAYQWFGSRSEYYNWSNDGYGSFKFSGYNNYQITGNLSNLKFEHIDSGITTALTERNIRIVSVNFLIEVYKKLGEHVLIYRVLDQDTNRDNQLNRSDISSLYISKMDGTNFKKLTAAYHELIDWNVVLIKNRLYFRSAEDTNKNGSFDEEDKIYYQFIDLVDKEWTVKQYNPL
ncbi:hypothetical protein [Croceiramulus getboli]|nr:hypothetical protein P8624_01095 [Flavobacteriaceae bacterium YJPT1-3]